MKIVFIPINTENIAVEYLSSYLKKNNHEAEIVFDPHLFASEAVRFVSLANFFDTAQVLVRQALAKKPDVIGFSVFTVNYQRALALARLIKKINPGLPIIFGGVHPTCVPDRVIEENCVDIVCVGEGELALVEYLDSLKNNQARDDIQNLWFKKDNQVVKNYLRPLIKNLDDLPFPDKKLFYSIYSNFAKDYYILASRGCPFRCTYCANHVLHQIYQRLGSKIRRRSPQNVIQELIWAKQQFKPKKITFVDDVFIQDHTWLKEFTELYKQQVDLPFISLTHPNFVNLEIARLLKDTGCYFLSLGVQSANEKIRIQILNRPGSNKQILRAAQACHQAKLKFSIDHIFNIPTENQSDYYQALKFYNQLRPFVINTFWLQYFPKTEIIKTAIKNKVIKPEEVDQIEQGQTSTSLVVGLGGKDDFNPGLTYTNFQFWMMVLPILPQWLMTKIIQHKKIILNFKSLLLVNTFIKFFVMALSQRGCVYTGIIKNMLYFIKNNLLLKLHLRDDN